MQEFNSALFDAASRIRPYIHRTAVLSSQSTNERAGARLLFKCENFQRMGAFKMRGAANAILSLSAAERAKGVVTHSSGNFAQAVSLAARNAGMPAYIVMPENAPSVKKAAVHTYGGQITECPPSLQHREAEAQAIVERTGATLLHPSNQLPVILGQGTAALELFENYPDLQYCLCPVGGGGLLAGTAIAAHTVAPDCGVIGAEPANADDAYRSLQSGTIESNGKVDTVADGLRTQLGDVNFPIIQSGVKDILLVSEEEIIEAMRWIWERMKIIVEPSSAVPLAAVFNNPQRFEDKSVGIILSGGNVDLDRLPF